MPYAMRKGDPRKGRPYRRAVAECIAASDLCHLCGHHGARTADHVISVSTWFTLFGTYQGVNDPANLQPAHGTMRPGQLNPCPECGQLCNQSRGATPLHTQRSRDW